LGEETERNEKAQKGMRLITQKKKRYVAMMGKREKKKKADFFFFFFFLGAGLRGRKKFEKKKTYEI
jgi:hypothetical protein